MTKQEQLEHINRLIQEQMNFRGMEDFYSSGLYSSPIPSSTANMPCVQESMQAEFEHIIHSTQPALVVVPNSFFSYYPSAVKVESSTGFEPSNAATCSCGGNNNCCCHCQKTVTTPKKYQCPFRGCTYSTIRKSDMKIHTRTHTGEKPYKCPYADCNYAAVTRSILVIHIRTHTGEKPLKCTYPNCTYSSTNHSNLKVHMRTHTGEKPFKCSVEGCNYASITSSDLKKHMKVHRQNRVLHCSYQSCSYECSTPSAMKRHQKKHQAEKAVLTVAPKCDFVPVHYGMFSGMMNTDHVNSI